MKVILLKDVPKIGQRGDVKELKEGYVRNMLLPKGLAKIATAGDLKNIAKKAEIGEAAHNAQLERIATIFKSLKEQKIILKEKTNDKGHLFAKVGKGEVVSAVKKTAGLNLKEEWFDLPAPIKETGDYEIALSFEKLKGSFTLSVVGE